jgi:hypothetical protein
VAASAAPFGETNDKQAKRIRMSFVRFHQDFFLVFFSLKRRKDREGGKIPQMNAIKICIAWDGWRDCGI